MQGYCDTCRFLRKDLEEVLLFEHPSIFVPRTRCTYNPEWLLVSSQDHYCAHWAEKE